MTSYPPSKFHLPVSIADLQGYDFSVTPNTPTETVVAELEKRPSLPGVMVVEKGQLVGVITRLKLFERLGHRFGVELFLRKPIIQLNDLICTRHQTLPGYSRIDDAIQYALGRFAPDIYDPIVMLRDDGTMELLDINVLLVAQSRAMASLSNVVGNLEQIDRLIDSGREKREAFNMILQLLGQVVPYHQVAVLSEDEAGMGFVAHYGYRLTSSRANDILSSSTYALMLQHRQAIYIPNAHVVPAWKDMEVLGRPMAWMGVPLLDNDRPLGLLSIGRNVERAFSNDERQTALAFSQRITELLKRNRQDAVCLDAVPVFLNLDLGLAKTPVEKKFYRETLSLCQAFSPMMVHG